MSNNTPFYIELTPRFKKDLRELAKRYHSIRKDIQPLIDRLQTGDIIGDRITGVKYNVFKVRLKNSNIQIGKSGGYRVIYYVKTETSRLFYSSYDILVVNNR